MSGLEGVAAAASILTLCAQIVKLAQKVEDRYIDYKRVEGKRLAIERLNRHLNTDLERLREIKGPSPSLSDYQDCTQHFEERLLCAQKKLPGQSRLSFRVKSRLKTIPRLILELLDDFTTQLEDIQDRVTKDLAVKDAMVQFDPYLNLQEAQEKFDSDTRGWVLERIDAWYARGCTDDLTWKNVFLVVGPAGVGKTVISGVVCERGGCFAQPEAETNPESSQVSSDRKVGIQVGACVSIQGQSALARDPLSILKAVAYQLGFTDSVADVDWKDFFRNCLLSCAKKLAKKQDSIVVVVMDGLDECEDPQFGKWVAKEWVTRMPRCFAMFATSRYDYSAEMCRINFDDPKEVGLHKEDLHKAVRNILQKQGDVLKLSSTGELERASKHFVDLSERRFLYFDSLKERLAEAVKDLRDQVGVEDAKLSLLNIVEGYNQHFPPGIEKSVRQELERLSRLLATIPEVYESACEAFPHKETHPPGAKLQTEQLRERYILEIVAGPILACPIPLPVEVLEAVSLRDNLKSDSTRCFESVVVKHLNRSSLVTERNGCIQLRHDMARTVLSKEFDINESCGHKHLVSACINSWKESQHDYAVEFLTYHIAKSGRQVNKRTLKKMLEEAIDTCYSDPDYFNEMGIPQNDLLTELSMIGWDLSETFEETWKSLDSRKFIRTAIVIILARRRQWLVHDIEMTLLTLRELFVGEKDVQIDAYVSTEIAKVLADLHRLDESRKWYKAAEEKNIDKCGEALQSSMFRGLAELYLLLGQFTSAKDYYSKCSGGPGGVHRAMLESRIGLASDGIAEQETIRRLRNALKACQVDTSTNPVHVMECRTLLARCLNKQGRYEESEKTLRQAQDYFIEPDSVAYAESLYELGDVLKHRGRFDESMNALQTAIKIYTRHYGEEHGNIAECRTEIAFVLSKWGRHDEAVKVQRETNDLLLRIYLREENPEVVNGQHNLALFLLEQGQLDEAEELFRKVLVIEQKTRGSEHPHVAITLSNLGSLMREKGVLDEAEDLYTMALAIDRKKFPSDHPRIAIRLNNLASVLEDMGKLDEAEDLYRRALKIKRCNFGNDHFVEVATTLNNLGSFLHRKGDYDAAGEILEEAMEIRKATLGENHIHYAYSLYNVAMLRSRQGRYEDANDLFEKSLAIWQTTFGPAHRHVAETYWAWAYNLKLEGNVTEARSKWNAACKAYKESLGTEHEDYKRCVQWWRD